MIEKALFWINLKKHKHPYHVLRDHCNNQVRLYRNKQLLTALKSLIGQHIKVDISVDDQHWNDMLPITHWEAQK